MVAYRSLMGVSIAGLFATGILPGLLIYLFYMGVIAIGGNRENLPKAVISPTVWSNFIVRAFFI
ncbi:TRAP transporter large permease subunit [Sedimentitalea sp. XS_ASV28]|uniref:TRAP transporter large permease subunit n=1 Tax=Sedimentitalea sp. XS_ASV28 TaxID=3241296 RepID=UPI0035122FD4